MCDMEIEREREDEQEQRQEEETRPWSDIPFNISNLILGKVSLEEDEARFSCVCKNWCRLVEAQYSKLPMELNYNWYEEEDGVRSICKIKRPWCCLYYAARQVEKFSKPIYTILEDEIYRKEERGDFIGAAVVASRKGWLLLQNLKKGLYLLFNPFIKEIIRLPSVEVEISSSHRATMSADPTSPDCVIFLIESLDKIINISTWQPSADSWNKYSFDGPLRNCEDVIYSEGKFYCLFDAGMLGSFNLKDCTWVVLTQFAPVLKPRYDYYENHHMVKFQGELLLVCSVLKDRDFKPPYRRYWFRKVNIYSFDWHKIAWVKQGMSKNLEIGLFLDPMSFAVGAAESTKRIGGKVYSLYNNMRYCSRCHPNRGRYERCSECTSLICLMEKFGNRFEGPVLSGTKSGTLPPWMIDPHHGDKPSLTPSTADSIQDNPNQEQPSLAPKLEDSIQDNPTQEQPSLTPNRECSIQGNQNFKLVHHEGLNEGLKIVYRKEPLRRIWIDGPC